MDLGRDAASSWTVTQSLCKQMCPYCSSAEPKRGKQCSARAAPYQFLWFLSIVSLHSSKTFLCFLVRSESSGMYSVPNANIGSSTRCSAVSLLLWIDFSEFLLICYVKSVYTIFQVSRPIQIHHSKGQVVVLFCQPMLLVSAACKKSVSNLGEWIPLCLLMICCIFHLQIPVWFIDVTFALLLPAAAPAKPGAAVRPIAGRCVCVGSAAVQLLGLFFIFTCITEHCQKQNSELHGPSVSDYLVFMVVNIIYCKAALGGSQSESPRSDSSVRQR